jgi:uncharacterized protein YodC (DUF2158 family)
MAEEFKVGDVVQLKSGSPKMTVTYAGDEYGSPIVYCTWFVGVKESTGKYPPNALEKVS